MHCRNLKLIKLVLDSEERYFCIFTKKLFMYVVFRGGRHPAVRTTALRKRQSREVFLDKVCCFLGNHDSCSIYIAGNNIWHHGCVHNPKCFQTVYPKTWVHYGHRICRRAHFTSATRVIDSQWIMSYVAPEIFVGCGIVRAAGRRYLSDRNLAQWGNHLLHYHQLTRIKVEDPENL